MRARLAVEMSSTAYHYAMGTVVRVGEAFTPEEVPAVVARSWLESGVLVPVEEAPEAAMLVTPERAVRPRARGR